MAVGQVLLTGSDGMLGQAIVHAAEQTNIEIVKATRTLGSGDVFWDITGDEEPELSITPQTVIHTAAQTAPLGCSLEDYAVLAETNVTGTWRVAEYCLRHKAHLIFISGAIVYGEWSNERPKCEADPVNPNAAGAYALSKWMGEEICCQAANEGCAVTILRPSSLYGMNMRGGLLNALMKQAKERQMISLEPPFNDRFDLLHVGDAAQTILGVAQQEQTGLFNIGGSLVDLLEIAETIGVITDVPVVKADHESERERRTLNWVDDTLARDTFGHAPCIDLKTSFRLFDFGKVPL